MFIFSSLQITNIASLQRNKRGIIYPLFCSHRQFNMYIWVMIATFVAALLVAIGIGANDLANAFGPVYGAKVLSLHKIVIIAGICEFGGAVLLGSEVAKTIGAGISKNSVFANEPYVFMYGMFAALAAPAFWLLLATFKKLPVSTTHSIVGSVFGMALVYGGSNAVIWAETKSSLPFVQGVIPIFVAWFASPIVSMLLSMASFWLLRRFVLRQTVSSIRAAVAFGLITCITFFIDAFYVFHKGHLVHWSTTMSLWVSAIIAVVAGGIGAGVTPWLMQSIAESHETVMPTPTPTARVRRREIELADTQMSASTSVLPMPIGMKLQLPEQESIHDLSSSSASPTPLFQLPRIMSSSQSPLPSPRGDSSVRTPVGQSSSHIERFSRKYERVFQYLLIYSAVIVAFAHGANDGGELVGAAAVVYDTWREDSVPLSGGQTHVPFWLLACGGVGLICGSHFFGAHIMEVLGDRLVVLSPSRGFISQFGAALVVSLCSSWGLPVSSTHCLTCSIVGIGLMESSQGAVDWKVVGRTAIGWGTTLCVACAIASAAFAQGIYSPCL